jgi:hypothetical protein
MGATNAKAPVGYCDVHKSEPAVVAYAGPETGQKKKLMCRECWARFRTKGKRLKED